MLEKPLESVFGYYLVTPMDWTDHAPLIAFREWLLDAVARHQKGTAA